MNRAMLFRHSAGRWLIGLIALAPIPALAQTEHSAAQAYGEHCASCHGADRLGGAGPALIPEALSRLKKDAAIATIAKGRAATQMPAFADKLAPDAIAGLADYIYRPLAAAPTWGAEKIAASRVTVNAEPALDRPTLDADPLNLFVVVEAGDHHVTIMNGDTFTPMTRFASRFALHGGPKFSPDGRFVYFMSRDGWITKYDLWSLKVIAEVRAAINSRNIALSRDGKHLAVAAYLPQSLVLLSAGDLSLERIIDAKDAKGRPSRVSAVYQARPRNSFIVALKDVPEVWEVATDPDAPPVHEGLVHSHEKGMVEALPASKGLFALRRIAVDEPLDDFLFDQSYRHLLGSSRDGKSAVVVNLHVGRPIARIDMPGLPHLGSGVSFKRSGRQLLALPHLKDGAVSVIDPADWSVVKRITTGGPGFFLRSHEGSPYIWSDAMMGPKKDTLALIDKTTLEIARTVTPAPGKTAAHVELDRSGRHALVSIWENDGALVVYDTRTLEEVKRLPMSKPSGKYNVYNKITFEEGTSH
jgi:mono/diheme cytochrome c family protein